MTGKRKDRGKNDALVEQISVVLLRTELLQRQHRFVHMFKLLCVSLKQLACDWKQPCSNILQIQRTVSISARRPDRQLHTVS